MQRASLVPQMVKSACNAGDPCLIPGLRRFPGGGHGNPLQYSWLDNAMDRKARLSEKFHWQKSLCDPLEAPTPGDLPNPRTEPISPVSKHKHSR